VIDLDSTMGLVQGIFFIRVKSKASITAKKYDRKCEYTYFSSHYHQNEQLSHIHISIQLKMQIR
jgi:hypothetical protein